jgi:peptide/nickel transport system ATP-binding protein
MTAEPERVAVDAPRATSPILSVRDLRVSFRSVGARGPEVVTAIDGVSLDVPARGTLGLVGESGSGKSVTSLAIMRLLATPPATIDAGRIELAGRDLLRLSEREMRAVRGAQISMIFQEPMTSLNPVYSVGDQIVEAIRTHRPIGRGEARARAVEMLRLVGIPAPESRARAYPHELSGGMRQRVMIAMALSCEPKVLIADEPTTALDVTIQAQVLDLLRRLQAMIGMSVLLITHDLGVVAESAQEVAVMYAGRVIETGPTQAVFARPKHPYTRGLLAAVPRMGSSLREASAPRRLPTIEGMVPDLRALPAGCRFAPRCPDVVERCTREEPELLAPMTDPTPGRASRCHRRDELGT